MIGLAIWCLAVWAGVILISRLNHPVLQAHKTSVVVIVMTTCFVVSVLILDPEELRAWNFEYKAREKPVSQAHECSAYFRYEKSKWLLAFISCDRTN